MSHKKFLSYLIVMFSLSATFSKLQAQINVTLQQPLPFQFKIENFWRVVLVNIGEDPLNIYLVGTAIDQMEERIIEATSSVITLQRGTKILTGRDLGPFEIHESETRYSNLIARTGSIPSGNYDICIEVFDAGSNRLLGGDCVQMVVENLSRIELISPFDAEIVSNFLPGNKNVKNLNITTQNTPVIFSWMPPVPTPPGIKINYRLKVVEMIGYQSALDAIRSNPAYYESPITQATVIRYPLAARQFRPGKKYCWKIEVFLDDNLVHESEVRFFQIPVEDVFGNDAFSNLEESHNKNNSLSPGLSNLPSGLSIFKHLPNKINNGIILFPRGNNSFYNGEPGPYSAIPITFSGDAKLTGYASSRTGLNSQLPKNYTTLEINPRLTIYEIPFGVDILLSSLNDPSMQSINSFSLNFDLNKLQKNITDRISRKISELASSADTSLIKMEDLQNIKDTDILIEYADKLGMISSVEKFFMDVKTLGIGKTYPEYSEFTLSGVPINGINLEYNPGIFYTTIAAYNNFKGIDDVSFNRSAFAARIGIGQKHSEHVFFTFMRMKDDENSIQVITNSYLTPQENQVMGTEGKLLLFDKMVSLTGEAAISLHTRNVRDADYQSGSLPGFVKSIYNPKLSTSYDYAWHIKAVIDQKERNAFYSLGIKRVGPGFVSFGSPNVRSDQLAFETFFNKKFDKTIGLKTNIRVYLDNLGDWKTSTTTTATMGISVDFTFPQMPYFLISYNPNFQSNDNVPPDQLFKNDFHMISFMTMYSYNFGSVFATSALSINANIQNSKLGTSMSKFTNTFFSIIQNLSFEFPLILNATLNFMKSEILSVSTLTIDFDLNGTYQLSNDVSALLGINFANEENFTRKISLYTSFDVIFYEWLTLYLRGDLASYKDLSGTFGDFDESIIQASLRYRW